MNAEHLNNLIEKFLEGETSIAEEQQLRRYFNREEIPKELQSYASFFDYCEIRSGSQASSDIKPFEKVKHAPDTDSSTEENPLNPKQHSHLHLTPMMRPLQIAAGIILLLIGFSAGLLLNNRGVSDSDVAALQQEVQTMKEALMYGGVYSSSAGERLSAVNLSARFAGTETISSDQVVDILVYTMNNDKSVNVRMAAAEALFRFRSDPYIQKALIHSLARQEEPLIQITLIDMLVELNAKNAMNEMKKLLMASETSDIVKERLETGIAELRI